MRHPYDDTMPTPLARSFERLADERDVLACAIADAVAGDRQVPARWLPEYRALDAAVHAAILAHRQAVAA